MSVEELAEYFDYVPIVYGEECDYAGLRILAHPSIHSVPCAIYLICGIVGGEWKIYGHMSDILNFQRCYKLVQSGYLTKRRLAEYKKFVLTAAAVKKIDVGTRAGTEDFAVHGSWRDFIEDESEHIVLAHTSADALEERATVQVGQFAVVGSARDMGQREIHTYQDTGNADSATWLTTCFRCLKLASKTVRSVATGSAVICEFSPTTRFALSNLIRPFSRRGASRVSWM